MLRKGGAAASAAAMAAFAALAGPAAAQEETAPGGTARAGCAACSGFDDPCPGDARAVTPATRREHAPTDLGTLEVQVDKLPPVAQKKSLEGDDAKSHAESDARQGRDAADDPFAGLPSPLLAPPVTGVPNVLIDEFRIPPFLLPIYQAAGVEYGVRWEVLAAINEIETDYGRNLSRQLRRRRRLDAVHARRPGSATASTPTATAARTPTTRSTRSSPPRATCAPPAPGSDLKAAIFAYNHAGWYVDDVLARARGLAALPTEVVGALTGLTMGRPPVDRQGRPTTAAPRSATRPTPRTATRPSRSPARTTRTSANVYARPGAAAVAVQDGKVVRDRRAASGSAASCGCATPTATRTPTGTSTRSPTLHAVPRAPTTAAPPRRAATHATRRRPPPRPPARRAARPRARRASRAATAQRRPRGRSAVKERLFADPARPQRLPRRRRAPDRSAQQAADAAPQAVAADSLGPLPRAALRAAPRAGRAAAAAQGLTRDRRHDPRPPRRPGARRPTTRRPRSAAASSSRSPTRRTCSSRSGPPARARRASTRRRSSTAGSCSSTTDVYRSSSPMLGADGSATIGQILLMSKELLERRVLADKAVDIYDCGRQDIRAGHRRPPRARDARVPRRERPQADGRRACAAATATTRRAATSPSTASARPSTSPRSTARRSSATRARARSPTSRCAAC